MNCNLCKEKIKTWDKANSPIKCAFTTGVFSSDNWNCGTMDMVRQKAKKDCLYRDDMYYSIVNDNLVSWYKSRGCTDQFYDVETRENVTLEDALSIC